MSADGMGGFAARGAATVMSAQVARVALQMLGIVILARLLTPEDYGLVALVFVVISFADTFRDFGLSAAAIQAKTLSHAQRSNLFWLNLAIGVTLALLVGLGAPLVARVFDDPRLVELVRVMAVVFVITGAATQYRASLTRDLRFASASWSEVAGQAVALGVGVWLAVAGWGYWALATMQIVQAFGILILQVALSRWLPLLPRRGQQMGGLIRFGGFLVGSQLINYASNNIDSFVLGRRLGAETVGLYDRPYRLLMMPLAQVRAPSTSVAIPVLSRLQDESVRYGKFLMKGQVALGLGLVVPLGYVVGAADPIVELFLGGAWAASAPVLALLAVAAGMRTLAFVGYWVYLSRGLTGNLMQFSLVMAVLKISLVVAGGYWGLYGVAAAVALAAATEWPISLWWLARLTPIPLRGLVRGALRILMVAGIVGLAGHAGVLLAVHVGVGALMQVLVSGGIGALALAVLTLVLRGVRADMQALRPALRALRPRRPRQGHSRQG